MKYNVIDIQANEPNDLTDFFTESRVEIHVMLQNSPAAQPCLDERRVLHRRRV